MALPRSSPPARTPPSGHWEIAGVPVLFEWGLLPRSPQQLPQALLDAIVRRPVCRVTSATATPPAPRCLDDLGEEHMRTGKLIPLHLCRFRVPDCLPRRDLRPEKLYELCHIVRELLEPYNIGRVIARPFVGSGKGNFKRTGNRHDYSVLPPAPTVLDYMKDGARWMSPSARLPTSMPSKASPNR